MAAAEPEWCVALLLTLKAGLRLGETLALRSADVDLRARHITVRTNVWRGNEGTPKGGSVRNVPIPPSLADALRHHRHLRGPYVLCKENGTRLTEGRLKWPLERALRRAGISRDEGRIGWHDLRHTYGSHLAMRGVPLKVVQELMGHTTIEMTMRYAHLSSESREAAVQVLDAPATAT